MPVIHVQMMEGRSEEKVKTLITKMTETVASTLEIAPDRVRILVKEFPKTRWGIGGVQASNLEI